VVAENSFFAVKNRFYSKTVIRINGETPRRRAYG